MNFSKYLNLLNLLLRHWLSSPHVIEPQPTFCNLTSLPEHVFHRLELNFYKVFAKEIILNEFSPSKFVICYMFLDLTKMLLLKGVVKYY